MKLDDFQPRTDGEEKFQVRFWSTPQQYDDFKMAVVRRGLYLQDTFNQFMEWFVKEDKKQKPLDEIKLCQEINSQLQAAGISALDAGLKIAKET